MVEAAEKEVRHTEPGLVGWGRWSPAVEWSVLIDFQPGEGTLEIREVGTLSVIV